MSDLWRAVLRGLRDNALTAYEWRELLIFGGRPELQANDGAGIAELLFELVKDGGKPFALKLLDQANDVAFSTWQALETDDAGQQERDWLSAAINRPAGVVVEYWLASRVLLMQGKSGDERHLPRVYKSWFGRVIEEPSANWDMAVPCWRAGALSCSAWTMPGRANMSCRFSQIPTRPGSPKHGTTSWHGDSSAKPWQAIYCRRLALRCSVSKKILCGGGDSLNSGLRSPCSIPTILGFAACQWCAAALPGCTGRL